MADKFDRYSAFHFLADDTAVLLTDDAFLLINTQGETTKFALTKEVKDGYPYSCRMSYSGRKLDLRCYHLAKKLTFDFDRNGEVTSEAITFPTYVSSMLTPDDSEGLSAEQYFKDKDLPWYGFSRNAGRLSISQYTDGSFSQHVHINRTDIVNRYQLNGSKCFAIDPGAFPTQSNESRPPPIGLEKFCLLDIFDRGITKSSGWAALISIPSAGAYLKGYFSRFVHTSSSDDPDPTLGTVCDPAVQLEKRVWQQDCTVAMGPVTELNGNSIVHNIHRFEHHNETGGVASVSYKDEWWMYLNDKVQVRYVEVPVQ